MLHEATVDAIHAGYAAAALTASRWCRRTSTASKPVTGGDRDGDGVANRYDGDKDGDGIANRDDDRPNRPNDAASRFGPNGPFAFFRAAARAMRKPLGSG